MKRGAVPVGASGDGGDWSALHQFASGITRRLLRNPSDAEDAAQETMLRAYRAIAQGAAPDDWQAWLATIARREAFRVHGRLRPTVAVDEVAPQELDAVPDQTGAAIDRLTARQLLRGVDTDSREIIVRRFALDQSSSEIGAAMQIPPSTVRVRLYRCLGQLQQEWTP